MRVFFSSGKRAVVLPIASWSSVMEKARSLYNAVSSGLRGATWSLMPGIKISPLGLTREFMRKIRSVMGSWTVPPNTPECKSLAGPSTMTLK